MAALTVTPKSVYLEIRQLNLHYLDWGGPASSPMVLLHGFAGHAHVWDFFAPNFIQDFRVLALDQRGHGDSQWHARGAYGAEEHLVDILGFMEALELPPAVMVGHSMGGRHAAMLAACFPQRVRALVLVDCRPQSNEPGSRMVKETMEAFTREVESLEEVVARARRLFPALSEPVARHLAHWGGRPSGSGRLASKYDTALYHQAREAGWGVEPLWPYLAGVECPTLVVRGSESLALSEEEALRVVNAIPRASLADIPGAGHLVPLENPQGLTQAVASFCAGVMAGGNNF
ncbi:MAG: alpha/beta hydrolase [Chloroflexi bacterium]|nr:alpha/beta hydrolase [Chloroflexota bacterium]